MYCPPDGVLCSVNRTGITPEGANCVTHRIDRAQQKARVTRTSCAGCCILTNPNLAIPIAQDAKLVGVRSRRVLVLVPVEANLSFSLA